MTLTQYLDIICEKLNIGALSDRLLTTYLDAIAKHYGVDTSTLPDRLATTYLGAMLKARGVESVADNLLTTYLDAWAKTCGVTELPDKLVATYLDAIVANLDGGGVETITFVVTGDESFTYSSTSNAVYFMHSPIANIDKTNIISAECSHFEYGTGDTLAQMGNGEFIFNASNGKTTGNVSFKDMIAIRDKSSAVDYFKGEAANGDPVTITVRIRKG